MTLVVGFHSRGTSYLLADLGVTSVGFNPLENNKFGIVGSIGSYSLTGNFTAAMPLLALLTTEIRSSASPEEQFRALEDLLSTIGRAHGLGKIFWILFQLNHSRQESRLFAMGHEGGLSVLPPAFYVLGSGASATHPYMDDALAFFRGSGLSREPDFGHHLANFFNRWCVGDLVHEGFQSHFGGLMTFIKQDREGIYFMEPTLIAAFLIQKETLKIRLISQTWYRSAIFYRDSVDALSYRIFDTGLFDPEALERANNRSLQLQFIEEAGKAVSSAGFSRLQVLVADHPEKNFSFAIDPVWTPPIRPIEVHEAQPRELWSSAFRLCKEFGLRDVQFIGHPGKIQFVGHGYNSTNDSYELVELVPIPPTTEDK